MKWLNLRMKITPDYTHFLKFTKKGNLIPVYTEVLSDIDTPFSLLQRFKKEKHAFLLESITGGEHIARYSFIGVSPRRIIKSKNRKIFVSKDGGHSKKQVEKDFLEVIKKELLKYKYVEYEELPRFCGGFVGYISYDSVRFFEKLPSSNPSDLNMSDALFMEVRDIYIFDHIRQRMILLTHVSVDEEGVHSGYREAVKRLERMIEVLKKPLKTTGPQILGKTVPEGSFKSNFKKQDFLNMVKKTKRYISSGDIIQAVLSQRFQRISNVDDMEIYRWLRFINPSPYMFYLRCNDHSLIGSSPEVFVRCENGVAELRPIAGTRKRGRDEKEDLLLEKELLSDAKECAEHLMLVDLGRNDLGRVCEYGTVKTPEFMVIEKYSHVMHIVSDVVGKMKKDKDVFDLIRACFPAGTVSGAPKIRAMEIIDELEPVMRGPYAGCVGYFSYSGNLDTCITIRTIVKKGRNIYIQAGAGIVADSNPVLEYKECINKAKALNKAVDLAEAAGN